MPYHFTLDKTQEETLMKLQEAYKVLYGFNPDLSFTFTPSGNTYRVTVELGSVTSELGIFKGRPEHITKKNM